MSLAWMPLSKNPLSVNEVLETNARLERACYEQARAELELEANSAVDFLLQVRTRAQQIKMKRQGAK